MKTRTIQRKSSTIFNMRLKQLHQLMLVGDNETITTEYVQSFDENGRLKSTVASSVIEKTIDTVVYPLVEVTPKYVRQVRKEGQTPSFILKRDGKLYYTEIPENILFSCNDIVKVHKCGIGGSCSRLSGLSDEEGGCAKVRAGCKGLENYLWMEGFEVFNMSNSAKNILLLDKCEKYSSFAEYRKHRPKVNADLTELAWSKTFSVKEIATKNRF